MSFVTKKPFVFIGLLFLLLVALPATIFIFQKQLDARSHAAKTAILSFSPTSSPTNLLQVHNGTIALDMILSPGNNLVSLVRVDVRYDPSKIQPVSTSAFQVNKSAFPHVIGKPTYSSGEIMATLSVGSKLANAIRQPTKVGTITFKTLPGVIADTEAPIIISYGANTQIISLSSNSSPTENVIANTIPAYLGVGQTSVTAAVLVTTPAVTATPSPTTSPTTKVCTNGPSDSMLVIDKSGSMNDKVGTTTKIAGAKQAANNFIDILAKDTRNMIALVSFASTATLNSAFTNNYSAVKTLVNGLAPSGSTCTQCAIDKANQEIAAHGRTGIKHVVVLLTDGRANYIEGGTKQVDSATAEQKALDATKSGHATSGTIFYTIGLGSDVNTTFLQQIASSTGGQYYYSPTSDQLNAIYTQISQEIAKASIGGFVFNDANANGAYDSTELKLSGWTVQLTGSGASQSAKTDTTGSYTLLNLCDGTYTVKESAQSGWKQTLPANQAPYNVTITNGTTITGKNFGNAKARCSDGIDNDNNGFIDAKDSTCHTDGNPNNSSSYDPNKDGEHGGGNTCADSKDNNGNGFIDGGDPVCHSGGDPKNPWDPNLPENSRCSDSLDNDNNGFADSKDSTCHTDGNPNNSSSYDPQKDGEHGGGNTCADSKDNNGNGLIDGADPVCHTGGDPKNPWDPTLPETTLNTYLNLTTLLHGIGSSGDNANPTANSLSNKSPKRTTRQASVSVYDSLNKLVASAAATVTYSTTNGNYTGKADLGTGLTSGTYIVKVRVDQHLVRTVSGIQTITTGKENSLQAVDLVTGDSNNDNRLDILDYNLLLDCYSDIQAAPSCTATKKLATDNNDDGAVNQFDYNLFLREISTQPGD